ncbi:MAG: site-specific integrase [Bacteroidota bacterium]|nr:site-specific integrase [Bacteroidota bacterium]
MLNTEIAIPPNYWHKKLNRITDDLPGQYGKVGDLNKELQRQIRLAEDVISFGLEWKVKDPVAFVKKKFTPFFDIASLKRDPSFNLEEKESLEFNHQFHLYIESKKKKVSKSTINVFHETLRYLEAFEIYKGKKITFESFTYEFYDELIDFLTYEYVSYRYKNLQGLKVNTIGKTIKHLRLFLNDRMRRKIIPHMDISMFKTMEEQADAIYLNTDEIARIFEIDLSQNLQLEVSRDLFVLGCYTGLRFSDFSVLRLEDIRNNMLYKKQQKSDHWVIIPLREHAKNILTNKFKDGVPKISNTGFNDALKQIGKLAEINEPIKFSYKKGNRKIGVCKPKYEWITSHTCRRSFCTNEFLAGTPVELIMKISGHKSLKDFYKYIKVTP